MKSKIIISRESPFRKRKGFLIITTSFSTTGFEKHLLYRRFNYSNTGTYMNLIWNKEEHPNWYRDITPMHYLILGSFPPHSNKRIYPFFYPNTQNRFWKILASLAELPLQWAKIDEEKAVEERYEIMKKLQTGVQNLGQQIERKGISALDTDIRITKFHDIISIIDSHPELKRILLPGYSAINSTAKSFVKYLTGNGIACEAIEEYKPEKFFTIYYKERSIECIILNSTSTAAKIKYDFLLDQFRRALQMDRVSKC